MSFSIQDLAGTTLPQATSVVQPTQPTQPTPTQQTSASGVFTMKDLGAEASEQNNQEQPAPKFAPYDASKFGRYTTPENYEKWASQQPKIGPDSKPGEYEAWTSANTPGGVKQTLTDAAIPLAAGTVAATAALGGAAIPEVLPSVLPHTIEGVKAIGAWANAHPVQAYMLYQVIRELIPGAKKAMGIIKAVPTE